MTESSKVIPDRLRRLGYRIIAVSGKFTSSPLAMEEYRQNDSDIPIICSADTGAELATRVNAFMRNE